MEPRKRANVRRKAEILGNVVKCVKGGGMLIYSTCTFSLEENEMNVAWLLDNFKEFTLVDVSEGLKAVTADGIMLDTHPYDMTKTRRFYPHVSKGEGQFIAVLKKDEDRPSLADEPSKKSKKRRSAPEKAEKAELELIREAESFLKENLRSGFEDGVKYTLTVINGRVYLKPDIALPEYSVFAAGVCVGEMAGKRFAPHHQLFSAFGKDFIRRVNLTQGCALTADYLRGLEINVSDRLVSDGKSNGYAAVLVDGCPLGGGKVSGGVCKNHYPKGLRQS